MVRCWSILLLLFVLFPSLPSHAEDDEADPFETEMAAAAGRRYAIGIYDLYGVSHQGGKSFTDNDSVQYQTTSYDGQTTEPGIFFDYPYSERWEVRLFLGYQSSTFHGKATEVGVPIAPLTVSLNETLIALGAELKYFPIQDLGLWGAAGLEYDHGLSIKLALNGIPVPTFSEDVPNLIQLLLAVGFDFKILNHWLITPEFRISDAPAATPSILSYQGALGVGWLF